MLKLRSLPLLLAGLLAALCLCSPGLAAPKEADPNAPAFVDLSRVLAEYRKTAAFQKYGVRLRDQGRALNEEMRTLAKVRYCTEPERKEALAISAKPAATPEEKARLEALTRKSDAIENEHALLSQKQTPTAAEAKRLADIAQMR
ncbi:MAG TPA: hypothetical protein VFU47_13365, partial [Armatimonadota bacterium]|nr:hypothetical protein [Armatimonadota bacterium]